MNRARVAGTSTVQNRLRPTHTTKSRATRCATRGRRNSPVAAIVSSQNPATSRPTSLLTRPAPERWTRFSNGSVKKTTSAKRYAMVRMSLPDQGVEASCHDHLLLEGLPAVPRPPGCTSTTLGLHHPRSRPPPGAPGPADQRLPLPAREAADEGQGPRDDDRDGAGQDESDPRAGGHLRAQEARGPEEERRRECRAGQPGELTLHRDPEEAPDHERVGDAEQGSAGEEPDDEAGDAEVEGPEQQPGEEHRHDGGQHPEQHLAAQVEHQV